MTYKNPLPGVVSLSRVRRIECTEIRNRSSCYLSLFRDALTKQLYLGFPNIVIKQPRDIMEYFMLPVGDSTVYAIESSTNILDILNLIPYLTLESNHIILCKLKIKDANVRSRPRVDAFVGTLKSIVGYRMPMRQASRFIPSNILLCF